MNAIELLKKDHRKVAGLFKRYEAAEDEAAEEKEELFRMIKRELDVHARIEEEIFYPAAKQAPSEEAKELVAEAGEEHKQIKTLLAELDGMDADDEQFGAKMTVLKEDVEHHVEEEQDELFPKVRKALGNDRLEELGRQLEARKQALTATEGEDDADEVGARVSQGVMRATVPRSSAQSSGRGMPRASDNNWDEESKPEERETGSSSDTRDDVMGAISRSGAKGRSRSRSSGTSRSRSGGRSRSKASGRPGSTSRGRSGSTSRGRAGASSRGRSGSSSRGRSGSKSSGRSGSKSRSKSGRGRR
jgi:iron-sulfur cluster repair protein YtfE (RIC family)